MPVWSFLCALVGAMLAASAIAAAACPPAALLSGDPVLVRALEALLVQRGVETSVTPGCAAVSVEIQPRGGAIALVRDAADPGPPQEHVVTRLESAATVIESWTHSELLDDPRFARPVVALAAEARPEPATVVSTVTVRPPLPIRPMRAMQVFGAFETSIADDRTSWVGAMVGVCIRVGALCASARARFAAVTDGDGAWAHAERHGEDILLGGDVPLQLAGMPFAFGFGAGFGAMHTGMWNGSRNRGSQTFGLRGDVHLAWLIPLGHRLAVDVSASVDVAQVTDVESSIAEFANEPRLLGRLAAGLRFGGR